MSEPLDLDELEALCSAATPGPWRAHDYEGTANAVVTDGKGWEVPQSLTDARLIAAARRAVPALVARVRELEAENADLRRLMADGLLVWPDTPEWDCCNCQGRDDP